MDTMTRELRSQVCLSSTVPPMASGSDNVVSFYTDLSADPTANANPELRTITYDPTAKTLTERAYVGTGTSPSITYPSTPTRVKLLAENVIPYTGTPIFTYYSYNTATPPRPQQKLTTPLGTANLGVVARIDISFRTLMPKTATTRGSIVLQDEVYVRAADPNDPAPTPTCA
jgi:hypothetical protein